jgi:penicillin V acylase-like amidase (Ntn superfamily)
MQEVGWGLLDGMNDAGLAVSLTFGGRSPAGPGFAVNVVLRYLLQTCQTVTEAVERLRKIPITIPVRRRLRNPLHHRLPAETAAGHRPLARPDLGAVRRPLHSGITIYHPRRRAR